MTLTTRLPPDTYNNGYALWIQFGTPIAIFNYTLSN